MGRTRTKTKKSVPVVSTASDSPSKSKSTPTTPALLEKAQDLITQCDYDLAHMFIKRVLDREPVHPEAREMMGVVLLETGEIDEARSMFFTLIPPNQNAPSPPPPSAYLYLAQLTDDDPHTALLYYQHAIDILTIQLKGKERADSSARNDENEQKKNIVRAYVGMVEIWMDPSYDLCFDPNAEKTCENLLNLALQADPNNSEALQSLASVRLSQSRPDEAKECLSQAWSAWKDIEDPTDPSLPPLPTRLALVKLFLELSLFTPALLVLHGIMSSDDQEVEAWYLEGWCFFLMAEEARGREGGKLDELSWEELARDSRDCLETCQLLFANQEHPDTPLLEHARELSTKLDALGIKPLPADEDEGDDSWEDEDDTEDDEGDVDMS